uniref:NADH dehydrogenase [ubiquinone] 1 beta subcomplex subunit 7 n=1 Tax=Timema genevievae TaxID=629358 RepID=A0A7R9PM81_TIMGE|nr:unnamed protein product [Timema genevievae]
MLTLKEFLRRPEYSSNPLFHNGNKTRSEVTDRFQSSIRPRAADAIIAVAGVIGSARLSTRTAFFNAELLSDCPPVFANTIPGQSILGNPWSRANAASSTSLQAVDDTAFTHIWQPCNKQTIYNTRKLECRSSVRRTDHPYSDARLDTLVAAVVGEQRHEQLCSYTHRPLQPFAKARLHLLATEFSALLLSTRLERNSRKTAPQVPQPALHPCQEVKEGKLLTESRGRGAPTRLHPPVKERQLDYTPLIFEYLIAVNMMPSGFNLRELKIVAVLRARVVNSNIVCTSHEMIATEEQMQSAKLPLEARGYCAHKLLEYQSCRADVWPWAAKCHHERHNYLNCEYEE